MFSSGYYCVLGASNNAPTDGSTGDICPAGSYCPVGSSQHIYCPNGTFTNHTGASECYTCPEGYYCTNRDRADQCEPGFYCPEGTGADLQPCPAGTYNPSYGMGKESDCTQCEGGQFCLLPGQSAITGNCSAGYYCTSGVDMATPSTSVNNTGVGQECPLGYYCTEGSVVPTPCASGTYA